MSSFSGTDRDRTDRVQAAAGVLGLATLALAQPVFDAAASDFGLGVSGPSLSSGAGLWLGALGLTIVPAASLVVIVELGSLPFRRVAGRDPRTPLYAVVVGLLAAVAVLFALGPLPDRPWAPVPALAAGVAVGRLWARRKAVQRLLALVGWVAPLAPLLFLSGPQVRPLWSAGGERDAAVAEERIGKAVPVVVVVFEELPLATLLDPRGEIEEALFPNLAGLSRVATWHRGAVTPAYEADAAVRALVTGRESAGDLVLRGRRRHLFGLLRASHRAVIAEPLLGRPLGPEAADTRLAAWAARSLEWAVRRPRPDAVAADLPPSIAEIDAFLERIPPAAGDATTARADERPLFVYARLPVPRRPWVRLASGRLYDAGSEGLELAALGDDGRWVDDEMGVLQAYRRHLLQAAYADRLLGRLLGRLGAAGVLDRALLVVTATHGIHFGPGEPAGRATDANRESLARIPLLVKAPGQTEGRVDGLARSLTDVLPTVIDVVEAEIEGWALDGGSLLAPPPLRPGWPKIESNKGIRGLWYASLAELGDPDRPDPLHWGPLLRRLWRAEVPADAAPSERWTVRLDDPGRFRRPDGPAAPLRVAGTLHLVDATAEGAEEAADAVVVALSAGGEVWATAQAVPPAPSSGLPPETLAFEALLPEGALAAGEGLDLGVYRVLGDAGALYLQPLARRPPESPAAGGGSPEPDVE